MHNNFIEHFIVGLIIFSNLSFGKEFDELFTIYEPIENSSNIEKSINSIHNSVNRMREVQGQLDQYSKSLKSNEKYKVLIELGKEISVKLDLWERKLIQPDQKTFQDVINFNNQLNAQFMHLKSYIDGADPEVTVGAIQRKMDLDQDYQMLFLELLTDMKWKNLGNVSNKIINLAGIMDIDKEKNFVVLTNKIKVCLSKNTSLKIENVQLVADQYEINLSLKKGHILLSIPKNSKDKHNVIFSNYLYINYVPGAGELTILCGALIGSALGFLWYNAPPAMVFMGDTGSLSLGATLGAIAVMIKHEIVLAIVGGLFVVEALSVIIQVAYFKSTGKRFFLMAPLHHHFEKKGWPESQIVIRFWIITIILAIVGLATLKLR